MLIFVKQLPFFKVGYLSMTICLSFWVRFFMDDILRAIVIIYVLSYDYRRFGNYRISQNYLLRRISISYILENNSD